jgi:glutamate racemase
VTQEAVQQARPAAPAELAWPGGGEAQRSPRSLGAGAIGVFDSGIGGLSVLRALRAELPHERFVYYADTGHAPYGERGDAYTQARSMAVVRELIEQHRIKMLVVACNTATAAAVHLMRAQWPQVPIVGLEPALKPAAALSRTGRIAVLATRGTLSSAKFRQLHDALRGQAEFLPVPCDGLAGAIERQDAIEIEALCSGYMRAVGTFGTESGQVDTVILGCTTTSSWPTRCAPTRPPACVSSTPARPWPSTPTACWPRGVSCGLRMTGARPICSSAAAIRPNCKQR